MSASECLLFAGPTLYGYASGALSAPPGIRLLPPARRGDVAALTHAQPPGVMVLVDGLFHSHPAVGHAELREALAAGWQVWGLGSLGAIRAYEMRQWGMRGVGMVYALFAAQKDNEDCFQDDEVALLHSPDVPYTAVSEPLVHLRAALDDLCQAHLLSAAACENIAASLKSLWYGDRTLRLFAHLVAEACAPELQRDAGARIAVFDPYRLKTRDLEAFLRVQPWHKGTSSPHPGHSAR